MTATDFRPPIPPPFRWLGEVAGKVIADIPHKWRFAATGPISGGVRQ